MTRPKTPVEKRLEHIDNKLARMEMRQDRTDRAIGAMAKWLVMAKTGFSQTDYEGIEAILRGDKVDD